MKFDLDGQGQSPSKSTNILIKVFCTRGPNLEILAWKGDELWRGQSQTSLVQIWWSWLEWVTRYNIDKLRFNARTRTQTQATTIPESQNLPWVKLFKSLEIPCNLRGFSTAWQPNAKPPNFSTEFGLDITCILVHLNFVGLKTGYDVTSDIESDSWPPFSWTKIWQLNLGQAWQLRCVSNGVTTILP